MRQLHFTLHHQAEAASLVISGLSALDERWPNLTDTLKRHFTQQVYWRGPQLEGIHEAPSLSNQDDSGNV